MAYVKRRQRPAPGSIPDLLDMFEREARFYREIGPEVGVRVPELLAVAIDEDEVVIELEDLSAWADGGDPVVIARDLKQLHNRWHGTADERWPWLNRAARAADEIGALYNSVWSKLRERADVTSAVRRLGDSLDGRISDLERSESATCPRTLVHGDAATRNMRTSSDGEVALLDWEDVRTAAGEVDLTWLLLSSVDPHGWEAVISAYEPEMDALVASFPANAGQALFGLSDSEPASDAAKGWIARLEAAAQLLD